MREFTHVVANHRQKPTMISKSTIRARVALVAIGALVATAIGTPALAAVTPVDVSGPVNGLAGPGVAVTPATDVLAGDVLTVTAENLPTSAEAAAWVDDGNFDTETGTYSSSVTVALCGNADSAGVPFTVGVFDPLLHCDGGDARSSSFLTTITATLGQVTTPVTTRSGAGLFDFDDDANPVTPPIQVSAGIGSAQATCVPDVTPCAYLLQDAASSVFSGLTSFIAVAGPTLSLVSVTGQAVGAQAARGGNDLVVSGANWDPASALAVVLCEATNELVCDASSSTAGLSVDAGGLLSGSVPVTTLNTVGARALKITQLSNGRRALLPIPILGPRTITLDPASGGASTAVNITGTDFDPLQAVTVTGSDGVNPTSDVGSAVVDSTGGITGSILVLSPATVSIVVTEDDAPTTEGASSAFDFTIQGQVGTVVIDGSAITLTQAGGQIAMSPVTLADGAMPPSTGLLQTVTLDDARGTLSGWSVTATATDWTDIAEPDPLNPTVNHVIPAGNLGWTPFCAPAVGSVADPAEVIAGPPASLDPVIPVTLCSAAPGGGGGSWTADALLFLDVPASIAAATYQATLTIVAA